MSPRLADQPEILRTRAWGDYALVDSGEGQKLERYGQALVVRPEPQAMWHPAKPAMWDKADAVFDPTDDDEAGNWRFNRPQPETTALAWGAARFNARFTNFRHLAFFPEQAANWEWLQGAVAAREAPRILNLFGYTGVASLVCSAAGGQVTHVDASKKSVAYARENAELSSVSNVRWIVEDARKFVQREIRRGNRYDGIILDPPKYGRGADGEVWRLFEDTAQLVSDCAELLAEDAAFLLINAYAARISGMALAHLLADRLKDRGGVIDWGELGLVEDSPRAAEIGLSFFARWSDL